MAVTGSPVTATGLLGVDHVPRPGFRRVRHETRAAVSTVLPAAAGGETVPAAGHGLLRDSLLALGWLLMGITLSTRR